MRWFWLFILSLVILTCGLYMNRVRTNAAIEEQQSAAQAQQTQRPTRPRRNRESKPETKPVPKPETKSDSIQEPIDQSSSNVGSAEVSTPINEPDQSDETIDSLEDVITEKESEVESPVSQPENENESDLEQESQSSPIDEGVETGESELDLEQESTQSDLDQPIVDSERDPASTQDVSTEPEPEIVIDIEEHAPIDPGPTYTQHDDGSFTVLSTSTTITGLGTREDPYELDWVTLRSIERVYEPKEDKTDLPDWLDLLDEAHIRITGNTLVPVIATTTRELLVMQNPWDGCCIGIPPSPYDAIEVTLNHDVDFGSSAVGYGTVEGIFVLDPYVVDGWVLGLYLIEEASYRSGDGIAFPDF